MAQFRDHRGGGAATVDDDACVFTQALDRRTGDGALMHRNRLGRIADQFLGHGDGATVTTQQQPLLSSAARSLRMVTSEVSKRLANSSTLTSPCSLSKVRMLWRRCGVFRFDIT
jgi:hypothetical protein